MVFPIQIFRSRSTWHPVYLNTIHWDRKVIKVISLSPLEILMFFAMSYEYNFLYETGPVQWVFYVIFISGLFPVLVRWVFFIILISGIALDFLKMIPINIFVAICKNMRIVLMGCHYRECWIWNWSNTMSILSALWILMARARFLSLAWSKLRLCSANHRPGYWCNLPCDCPSTAWAYSEQETENMPCALASRKASSSLNAEHAPMHCQLCYFRSHVKPKAADRHPPLL